MKFIKMIFIGLFAGCILTACENEMFGMPESQFTQLNPEQKQQVIQAYNERKLQETKNAPLYAAIGALGSAAKVNKTTPLSNSTQQECHWEGNTKVCNYSSSSSSVNFGFK
ncbi:MAG: hypothetical protein K0S11_1532 [Gammaproteobacteria bacterium]|jgi:hypothetical protein|nr:hypothetical protein [Gammaproteobacteria bacterium]